MSSLLTWFLSPVTQYVSASSGQVAQLLDKLNTLVNANSGNAGAYWEVLEYVSTSPRSLMLGRKNGAAGRVVFFGEAGSTPHANAVRSTTSATGLLFVAYSATSTATNVSSWISGAPLAASDYIPGVPVGTVNASAQLYLFYLDHADGFFAALQQTTSSMWLAGGGEIIENEAGTAQSAIVGSGQTIAGTGFFSDTSGIFPGTPVADASYANSGSAIVGRIGGSNILLFRAFALASSSNTHHKFLDLSTFVAHLYPIWLLYNTTNVEPVYGKFRQIAFGPACGRASRRITGGSPPNDVIAFGLGSASTLPTSSVASVWFPNIQV